MQVNMHEAKTNFSKLIRRVLSGEEVIIAYSGKPVARLEPIATPSESQRTPGSAKGAVEIRDDFDAPLPDDLMAGFDEHNSP